MSVNNLFEMAVHDWLLNVHHTLAVRLQNSLRFSLCFEVTHVPFSSPPFPRNPPSQPSFLPGPWDGFPPLSRAGLSWGVLHSGGGTTGWHLPPCAPRCQAQRVAWLPDRRGRSKYSMMICKLWNLAKGHNNCKKFVFCSSAESQCREYV